MTQTELTKRPLTQVGQEITHELGAQMMKDYQLANPTDVKAYFIGRDIINQLLAQPSCVGIRFFNAYNEIGEKTLVYIGVDESGKEILKYVMVNEDGSMISKKAIVADRINNDTDDIYNWDSIFS